MHARQTRGWLLGLNRVSSHRGAHRPASEDGGLDADACRADGQLDAFFYAGGTPFAALIQLGSTKGFELYNFSASERKEINKIIPYYVESTIPAGTYETIGYDVATVAVNGQLVTSIDQPEDLIYGITKALWSKKTRGLLDKGHSKGKAIQMETALKGVLIPVHPGAAKFYKEKGLMK